MPNLSRRLVGSAASLLAVSIVVACSSDVTGSPASPSSTTPLSTAPPTSQSPSTSSSTAASSSAAGDVPQPVSAGEFLTVAEAGHPIKPAATTTPAKPKGPDPLGCLDIAPALKTDPVLKKASFKTAEKDQNYTADSKTDASFLEEGVFNTTEDAHAALIARELGKVLAACKSPTLTLFGTTFTASKAAVSAVRPNLGCASGTTSFTVALGRPPGGDPNKPLAVEIDSYALQQGTNFAYVLSFYPLIQGDPVAAIQLAGKICNHLH